MPASNKMYVFLTSQQRPVFISSYLTFLTQGQITYLTLHHFIIIFVTKIFTY
jgi:hypothetical protein